MRTEEAIAELTKYLSKKPFRPFRVVLTNGEKLDVIRQFQLGFGVAQFGVAPPKRGAFVQRRLDQILEVSSLDGANALS